jgi:hypothetical protein
VSGDREAASQTGPAQPAPATGVNEAPDHTEIVQRWRETRDMLIRQLDAFESGALTLRASNVNVSGAAIADLKRSILQFDALISGSD